MKLFLDAHISGPVVAKALRKDGHDVRAAGEERQLDSLPDEELLELAARDGRILITFDVNDFPDIVGEWATRDKQHAGCAIVVGIDHGDFGVILKAIRKKLADLPDPAAWIDYTCFIARR